MACILVKPDRGHKGVLSVTTSEMNQILDNGRLIDEVREIKNQYYLGLHHNWHPVDFEISSEFDFHFLESKDAIFFNGREQLMEMDACNFTPACFSGSRNIPIWDLLIVGRTANFKRPYKTIETVRELFDRGHFLKILWICPMDLEKSEDQSVAKAYECMFSQSEKELFTLLNPQANYPFTFSRQELSLFYLSSRSYVHFADVETRCRVAAYAFCAGIPVIGNSTIANILPKNLAVEPTFFEVKGDDYVSAILKAKHDSEETNQSACIGILSESASVDRLIEKLNIYLNPMKKIDRSQIFASNLDIRLGAAHTGIKSSNSYELDLIEFISGLTNENAYELFENIEISSMGPENELCSGISSRFAFKDSIQRISIKNFRKSEIKVSRNGQIRFNLYRAFRFANNLPLLGVLLRNGFKICKSFINNRRINK